MFVAIVANQAVEHSGRPDGSLAAFLDYDKEDAIKKAIRASEQWERQLHNNDHPDYSIKRGTPRGPYRILVAEIKEEAERAPKFELVKYKEF